MRADIFADCGPVAFWGVEDDFVMDVHDDLAARSVELAHGVGEQVVGDGLDEVLHEFAAVGFANEPPGAWCRSYAGLGPLMRAS